MPFGAGLLDILNQGGQFLAGRQAGQKAKADAEYERQQKAALQQALIEQYKATAENLRAEAEARRNPVPREPTLLEREAKATGQIAPFSKDNRSVGENVSDTIAHLGFKNVDPALLFRVAQQRADAQAALAERNKPALITDEHGNRVPDVAGVKAYRAPVQPEYAIGPDNKLVVKAPGVEVKAPGATGGVGARQSTMVDMMDVADKELEGRDASLASGAVATQQRLQHAGDTGGVLRGAISDVMRSSQTPDQQVAASAMDNFATEVAHYISGARISDQQLGTYRRIFGPQPGEGPEAIKAKAARRKAMIAAARNGLLGGQPGPNGEPDEANAQSVLSQIETQYPITRGGSAPTSDNPYLKGR